MFSNASNFVKGVDNAFIFILGVAVFFLITLTVVMIYFIFRYNNKRNVKATQIEGSTILEILWTTIPTILVLVMFYFGWEGYKPRTEKAPADAMVIKTTARMWSWSFEYPNGRVTDTLYIPLNKAIKLDLKAMDVIHSLYIPAFRLKQDINPGRKEMMWFIPEKTGRYDLFCTEYCGLQHSYMISAVEVLADSSFKKWYTDTTAQTAAAQVADKPGAAGLAVLKKNGCFACHSVDGSKLVGPSYKGIFGKKETVEVNGAEKEVSIDEAYIKNSIYEPNAEVVKGFSKNLMQPYKGMITDKEIEQIIEYFKTLK